jgi:hypothetical protein
MQDVEQLYHSTSYGDLSAQNCTTAPPMEISQYKNVPQHLLGDLSAQNPVREGLSRNNHGICALESGCPMI